METRLCGSLLLWLLSATLAACAGGSGSSGFDIRSENSAIEQALAEQRCVQRESLSICPAAEVTESPAPTPTAPSTATPSNVSPNGPTPASTPAATATPTPTATPPVTTPQVEIHLDRVAAVPCVGSDQGGACSFTLPFEAQGFAPEAAFRVATRTVNPDSRWTIGAASLPVGLSNPSSFEGPATVSVPANSSDARITAQAAVLVFEDPSPGVPDTVEELADTAAEAAYVTAPFTLEFSAPAP